MQRGGPMDTFRRGAECHPPYIPNLLCGSELHCRTVICGHFPFTLWNDHYVLNQPPFSNTSLGPVILLCISKTYYLADCEDFTNKISQLVISLSPRHSYRRFTLCNITVLSKHSKICLLESRFKECAFFFLPMEKARSFATPSLRTPIPCQQDSKIQKGVIGAVRQTAAKRVSSNRTFFITAAKIAGCIEKRRN